MSLFVCGDATKNIDAIPLDSETCAACGHILSVAQCTVGEMGGQVEMLDYKFTKAENVARVMKMGVKKLPSLYINGELKFSSLIPSNRELIEEIKKAVE